ncbi:hypothetical protein BKA69DRAFT_371319 [Paraphysoderma sedebokerense]|nr:hypothetical protein BKA69DRAFT_371319 [Paraphysoderma sedebokerense]
MKEYIDTFNKNFVREMQADVDVIEMKSYQKVVFREFQNAEAKFVTQFKNRMTPEELTAWKSNPTYSEISESYMHYWEKRANPLDAASFAKRVEELGLPKEQVTFATHDGFIVETKTGNTYIHFFEKKGTNAPRYIIQQTASKKMKRISFVRDSNTGAVKLEMKKLEIQAAPAPAPAPEKNAPAAEPAQPAVEPCRRRLSRRQGAGCIRNKAEFKPNIEDPKSVRFGMFISEFVFSIFSAVYIGFSN